MTVADPIGLPVIDAVSVGVCVGEGGVRDLERLRIVVWVSVCVRVTVCDLEQAGVAVCDGEAEGVVDAVWLRVRLGALGVTLEVAVRETEDVVVQVDDGERVRPPEAEAESVVRVPERDGEAVGVAVRLNLPLRLQL